MFLQRSYLSSNGISVIHSFLDTNNIFNVKYAASANNETGFSYELPTTKRLGTIIKILEICPVKRGIFLQLS